MTKNKGERHQAYLAFFAQENNIPIQRFYDFAKSNGIPSITARRDLKDLEINNYLDIKMGLINFSNPIGTETPRSEKIAVNKDKKNIIAYQAQKLINDKSVFVCAGTTLEYLVKNIHKEIDTIYTNGLEIARVASHNSFIKSVFLIGGRLRNRSQAFCGTSAMEMLKNLRFSQAFISANKIDLEGNIYNHNEDEAAIIRLVTELSDEVICLMDSSKFFTKSSAAMKILNIETINTLVVDDDLRPELANDMSLKTNLIIAKKGK